MIAKYAYSIKVNENIDVHSCGVVLLEMITGQNIVEMEFGDMNNVVKWVPGKTTTKDGVWKVLDSKIKERHGRSIKVSLLCASLIPQ